MKSAVKIVLTCFTFLLSMSGFVLAQEAQEVFLGDLLISPRQIPGLEINANRFPGNATVITEQQIQDSGAKTLPALLSQFEGISLADSQGFGTGADTTLNLRGFVSSSRTNALVLVNGVRQNRITGDEVHWAAIPIEQIQRVEILRGGAGTIYGEGALAGVINITTKKGADVPLKLEGSAEIGSYQHFRASQLARGSTDQLSYSLGIIRQQAGGYRDRIQSRGTTVNGFLGWTPSAETDMEFHYSDHQDLSGFAGGLTKAQVEQNRKGAGSFPGDFDDWQRSASVRLIQEIDEATTAVAHLAWSKRESDSMTTFGNFLSVTRGFQAGLRGSHERTRRNWSATTIAGVDWLKDKATTGNRTGAKSESNRWAYGLFIEEALNLFEDWTVTLGFRYDKSRYQEDLTFPVFNGVLRFSGRSPKIGINYQVDEDLALYGSAARTFKAPNIDDLDAVLPPYNDSVNVKPQQADHYELGIRWNAADWMRVKGAGFVVHTKDEILFDTFAFSNANFTTRRAGLELDLRGKINQLHGTSYYVTHTLNQARFHKGGFTGNSIPLTPMHRLTAGLRAPITDRLTADLDLVWVGKQFRTNDFNNQFLADKYGVVNGGLEYIMPKKLFPRKFQSKWIPETKIYFQVLNLLDEEYSSFEASAGTSLSTGENPAPPRTWLVGASWEI